MNPTTTEILIVRRTFKAADAFTAIRLQNALTAQGWIAVLTPYTTDGFVTLSTNAPAYGISYASKSIV